MKDTATWLRGYLASVVPAALLRHAVDAVQETISALEKERDAARSDNAALVGAGNAVIAALAHERHAGLNAASKGLAQVLTQPHPGAALLEEHRKSLEKEQAALTRALETIRTAMGDLGEACREGGLIGIMNGMERIQERARNEGRDSAASAVEEFALTLKAHGDPSWTAVWTAVGKCRVTKEPES